jgi:WD40 repeat protein
MKPETWNLKRTTRLQLCVMAFLSCLSTPASAQRTVTLAQQFYGLGDLQCAAYSPDGNYILTGGSAGAFLWDVVTGRVVRSYIGHMQGVSSVAFSPDGTQVVTGGPDGTAKLWQTLEGEEARTFTGHTGAVRSVTFSPDGTTILTGGADSTACLWSTADGARIRTFSGHGGPINCVAFSPDGRKVLTGSDDQTARLWNLADASVIHTFTRQYDEGRVRSLAFFPDGTKIVTADGYVTIWDAVDGAEILSFCPNDIPFVSSVAVSPEGTMLLVDGDDAQQSEYLFGTVELWDTWGNRISTLLVSPQDNLRCVSFSRDGARVLVAFPPPANFACILNVSDAGRVSEFIGHTGGVYSASLSPNGAQVVTANWDCDVFMMQYLPRAILWDLSDGRMIREFWVWEPSLALSVGFSPDGTRIAMGTDWGTDWGIHWGSVILFDAVSAQVILTLEGGHRGAVHSIAFSPSGEYVLTGGGDGTAKLWSVPHGTLTTTFTGHTGAVYGVAFSPDGKQVATASQDKTARMWRTSDGIMSRAFLGHTSEVLAVAFSPDGEGLLTGAEDATARLWNTLDGTEVHRFLGHAGRVTSVAFSPDGTRVMTASDDGTAKLWHAPDGTLLRTFSGHAAALSSVAFTPDGTKILTGSYDGTARLWEIWRAKAVIVAGDRQYPNNIAEQTKQLAAYCYKICRRRGYAPNEIQYLSAFGAQDADGDGMNDVDASATVATLHDALDRFTSDTARLFIYMVDHGYRVGNGMYFQMNPTQTLAASDLDTWLDELQRRQTCHVTLIVDSCYAGNFLSACKPPPGVRRLTIASTTSDTVAVFLPPPALTSFSYQFLGALYMGYKVQQAFDSARQFFHTLGVANQTPWMDANGDGRYTPGVDDSPTGPAAEEFFGTSWAYAAGGGWEPPAFEAVTPTQSAAPGTTVTIWARMLPNQIPQRVWATILPPVARPLAGEALTDLPHVELLREGTTLRWSAPFGGLATLGRYVVAHVAQFEGTRITQPRYSYLLVGTSETIPIKAVLISGKDASSAIASQTVTLANLAYRVSRHRGYERDDIRYLSAFGNQDADGDRLNDVLGPSTVANVTNSLSTWAMSDCERLLVYLVGPGDKVGGRAVFRLSPTEVLTTATLDARLDALQNGGVRDIIVIGDFPYAAEFLRGCQPPAGKRRVLIAGTDSDTAVFLAPPQYTSFSFNFLSAAHMGHNLDVAFDAARQFFSAWSGYRQRPWLDDTGDGRSDPKVDGDYAQTLHWGYPWAFAGPEGSELPFILDAGPRNVTLPGRETLVWARLMEGPLPKQVMATIIPPTVAYAPGQPVTGFLSFNLRRQRATWYWSAPIGGFTQSGPYTILFQALYEGNRLSVPVQTRVTVGLATRHWRLY